MSSATFTLQGISRQPPARGVPAEVATRRIAHRRQTYAVQALSYSLGASVLLLYGYSGIIPMLVPALYFICGVSLVGVFEVLSELGVNDRFEDHYLTVFQIAGHVMLQIGFLTGVPEIGYAFLCTLFLIFGFGALRMTSRQATIAWTFATLGVAPAFLLNDLSIGMPCDTPLERFAALLCFTLTLGQCAFVGLYGSSLRRRLYERGRELKDAYHRIEQLAELDELTGAFNRGYVMRTLDAEISRAQRNGLPCSVALIDLDWFKRINDAYGHPTGDEVLRTFAITVFANIRTIDTFGRYGGEEFLLVLPETDSADAAAITDRLRAITAQIDWSALSVGMTVTISAGIATLQPHESADALLGRADRALYAAKRAGRNRIASDRAVSTETTEKPSSAPTTPGQSHAFDIRQSLHKPA